MPTLRLTRAALTAALLLVLAGPAGRALAQGSSPAKDDDLDRFLQNIDKPPSEKEKPAPKPPGDLSTKDKDLDGFLEKLGETKDAPATEDKPSGAPHPTPQPDPGKPQANADNLKPQDKSIDQRLEELLGRKPKKKGGDESEGSGPLGDVVKQMREIEERLGKPDTGEETRQKQGQVVKKLEQVIDQMRSMQPGGKKKTQLVMQKGQQPGKDQQGDQPGTTGGNAPHAKPATPQTNKRKFAGGKDEWGHLPPELRQEMDNVFKEEGLPSREDLIRRYYLSLSKKTLVREE